MGRFVKGQFVVVPNKDQALALRGASLAVYIALCSFADDDGQCFPSLSTLAKTTGYAIASVRRSIDDLLEQGLITKTARKRPNGSQTSNYYQIEVCSPVSMGGSVDEHPITQPNNSIKKQEKVSDGSGNVSVGAGMKDPVAADEAARLLDYVIGVINPKEKPTETRMRLIRGRLKEYTAREIALSAQVFSQSEWHRQNKQMSVDNLLAPSKFGRWYAQIENADVVDPTETVESRNERVVREMREAGEEQARRNKEFEGM